MTLEEFQELLSPRGQSVIRSIRQHGFSEATFLSVHKKLSKVYPEGLLRRALETELYRQKARNKIEHPDEYYFTKEALEQATPTPISRGRATRFAHYRTVADLCCSVGMDSLELAKKSEVYAIDSHPLKVAMARANLRQFSASVIQDDALITKLDHCQAIFIDPDRRPKGSRQKHGEGYSPSLSQIVERFGSKYPLAIKVAPAISWTELQQYDCEKEFVSFNGELKECTLWFGEFKRSPRSATVYPSGEHLQGHDPKPAAIGPIATYLYDLDPTITRSGLVGQLAERLNGWQFDPQIGLITSDTKTHTGFARPYFVEGYCDFSLRTIQEMLRSHSVGQVTLIKRGSPIEVNSFQKKLNLQGTSYRHLMLTRLRDKPIAILLREITSKEFE